MRIILTQVAIELSIAVLLISFNPFCDLQLTFRQEPASPLAKIAAVEPLLKEKLIKKAIQYHVIGGSTRLTPQTHGELLEDFLKRGSIDKLPGNVEARAL